MMSHLVNKNIALINFLTIGGIKYPTNSQLNIFKKLIFNHNFMTGLIRLETQNDTETRNH